MGATLLRYVRNFPASQSWLVFWLPLCLVVINCMLKFRHISAQSLAGDEPFSVYISQFDVSTIVSYLSHGNNSPLFEMLLHYWIKVFGAGVSAVRLLPCLFSSLTVWFIYRIGSDFFNTRIALFAGLLYTLSNYQMYFAHEARVYSLFLLLTCISFYAYLHLIKSPSTKFRIIHALSLILLPYAHYLAFFVWFIQVLLTLTLKELRLKISKVFFINLMIALCLFIPLLSVFIKRLSDAAMHGTWLQPVTNLGQLHDVLKYLTNNSLTNYLIVIVLCWLMLQKFFKEAIRSVFVRYSLVFLSVFFLFYGISIMGPMPYYWEFTSKTIPMIAYLVFMVGVLSFSLISKTASIYTKVIAVWFLAPLLIMFVVSFKVPMFLDRYLIFVTGGFYLLLAIGVNYLDLPKTFNVGLLLVLLLGITFETNVDKKRNVSETIQKVKELKTANTVVYMCPDYFDINFAYYYNRQYFKDIDYPETKKKLYNHLSTEKIFPINGAGQLDTTLFKTAEKVIYIDAAADFAYPANNIKTTLDANMMMVNDYFFSEIYHVYEYKPKHLE